jgi:sec-independent protein translocase protein TatA
MGPECWLHGNSAYRRESLERVDPGKDDTMPHFGAAELLIILALVLLLFGAKKVPEMARGLGQGMKEFKQGLKEAAADEKEAQP